jgi:hypothetical protein
MFRQALKFQIQLLEIFSTKFITEGQLEFVNDDIYLPFSLSFISWIRAFPGNSLSVHNAFRISNLAEMLVFSRKYRMNGLHKMENMPAVNILVQCSSKNAGGRVGGMD